jgi:hypothetical protein
MFSLLRRVLSETRSWLSTLRRLGLRVFFALTALQAVIVGVLVLANCCCGALSHAPGIVGSLEKKRRFI